MGKGAPKSISSIPDNLIVAIFVAGGFVHDTLTALNHNLGLAKKDPEDGEVWLAIEENRSRLSAYADQMNRAIRNLQNYMDRVGLR